MGKKNKKSSQNPLPIAASADKSEASTQTAAAKPEHGLINVVQGGIAIVNKSDTAIEGLFTGKLSACMAILLQGDTKFGLLHLDIYRNPESIKSLIAAHFGKIDQDFDLNYFVSPIFAGNIAHLLGNLPKFRANPEIINTLPNKMEASLYLNLLLFEKIFEQPLNPQNIIAKPGSTCILFRFEHSSPDKTIGIEFLADKEYESLTKATKQDAINTFAGAALDVTRLFLRDQTQDVHQQYISGTDAAKPNFDIPDKLQKDLELEKIDYSKFSLDTAKKLQQTLTEYNPLLSKPDMELHKNALAVEALTNIQKYFVAKKSLDSEIGVKLGNEPSRTVTITSTSRAKLYLGEERAT